MYTSQTSNVLTILDEEQKCTTHYFSNRTIIYSCLDQQQKVFLQEGLWTITENNVIMYRFISFDDRKWMTISDQESKSVCEWLAEKELINSSK